MVIFFSKKRVDFNWIGFFKEEGGGTVYLYEFKVENAPVLKGDVFV